MPTNNQLPFLAAALLLASALAALPSISADTNYGVPDSGPEKNIHVVVESMVYCQSCDLVGSWKVSYNNPISGATVSVLCRDNENWRNYYKTFETDKDGHLYAELKGFVISSKDKVDFPINSCYVRLVSSPNVYCDFPTNVNYGLHGSPLRYENKTIYGNHYQAEVYAAGPLAFRPAFCSTSTIKP